MEIDRNGQPFAIITDGTCGFHLMTDFTVGCDDLGAPCKPTAQT